MSTRLSLWWAAFAVVALAACGGSTPNVALTTTTGGSTTTSRPDATRGGGATTSRPASTTATTSRSGSTKAAADEFTKLDDALRQQLTPILDRFNEAIKN